MTSDGAPTYQARPPLGPSPNTSTRSHASKTGSGSRRPSKTTNHSMQDDVDLEMKQAEKYVYLSMYR